MSTTLPLPVYGGLLSWNQAGFQHAGKLWLSDPYGSAPAAPFRTSIDLLNWSSAGVYPIFTDLEVIVIFLGMIFVISPTTSYAAYSANGVSWTEVDTSALSGLPVSQVSVATLSNVLYCLKVSGSTKLMYKSLDGLSFTETATNLPGGSGGAWNLLVFGDVLYALPDANPSGGLSAAKVHSSTDGITWTPVGDSWGNSISSYGFGVFSGKVYLAGGVDGAAATSVVRSSSDLISWVTEVYSTVWPAREYPSLQGWDSALTLLGGGADLLDIWQVREGPAPPTGIPL